MPIEEVHISPRSPACFEPIVGPGAFAEFEKTAAQLRERLDGRAIWNVNSTAAGGGVAEMLTSLLSYVRGTGIDTRWVVIEGDADFFRLTKRIHNALHGELGDGSPLGDAERATYERISDINAAEFCARVREGDFVLLHDPQTAGLVPHLVKTGARVVWRCHIGNDHPSEEGDRAWRFLAPYLEQAHAFVFSRFAYVPEFCDHVRSVIQPPVIDPFSPKNQDMEDATVRAILVRTGLVSGPAGDGSPTFTLEDGSPSRVDRAASVLRDGDPPAWDRPLVVQVSRWDRLKDPVGILAGFEKLDGQHADLVLAGPDVSGVADDPEGVEVYREVIAAWKAMPKNSRRRVHLASLPMDDVQENAAIVNALQRHAAVVVQKSLREGFGLTVTEAMWKARPVLASAVGGIQDQIEHGVSGMLLRDPRNADRFASMLVRILEDPDLATRLGRNARRRVSQLYLGLGSLIRYAGLIDRLDRGDAPT
jgi:trehalose synthase